MSLLRRAALAMPLLTPAASRAAPRELREDWADLRRGRSLPVLVRLPEGRPPFPAVVVSHGLGGSRDGLGYLGRALAGAGFVALHLQHPGSDRAIWEGRGDAFRGMAEAARDPRTALDRLRDMVFAADELERRRPVDMGRLAAAGHSFGAWTVAHALGQALPLAVPGIPDRRFRAGVLLSPVPGMFGVDGRNIQAPLLHVTGTEDRTVLDSAGPEDRLAVFRAVDGVPQAAAVLAGAQHLAFAGVEELGAGRAGDAYHARTAALALLFLRATVLGDDAARREITTRPAALHADDAFTAKGWG